MEGIGCVNVVGEFAAGAHEEGERRRTKMGPNRRTREDRSDYRGLNEGAEEEKVVGVYVRGDGGARDRVWGDGNVSGWGWEVGGRWRLRMTFYAVVHVR